jgi:5'-3' exonuclease
LIGAATGYFRAKKYQVTIVSSDHDFYQLVRQGVEVYDDLKSEFVDRGNLRKRYPYLQPRDFAAVKALSGDRSDNIKGLPGIGEQAAIAIVEKVPYTDLCVFARAKSASAPDPEDFDKRIRWRVVKAFEDLKEAKKVVHRNLQLVVLPRTLKGLEIHKAAELRHQLAPERRVRMNLTAAKGIMREYQLNSILNQFDSWIRPLVKAGWEDA